MTEGEPREIQNNPDDVVKAPAADQENTERAPIETFDQLPAKFRIEHWDPKTIPVLEQHVVKEVNRLRPYAVGELREEVKRGIHFGGHQHIDLERTVWRAISPGSERLSLEGIKKEHPEYSDRQIEYAFEDQLRGMTYNNAMVTSEVLSLERLTVMELIGISQDDLDKLDIYLGTGAFDDEPGFADRMTKEKGITFLPKYKQARIPLSREAFKSALDIDIPNGGTVVLHPEYAESVVGYMRASINI